MFRGEIHHILFYCLSLQGASLPHGGDLAAPLINDSLLPPDFLGIRALKKQLYLYLIIKEHTADIPNATGNSTANNLTLRVASLKHSSYYRMKMQMP